MFKILIIYNSENNINSDGVSVFCSNTLDIPLFICFDNLDNGYVTNSGNDTISKINMNTGGADVYIDSLQGLLNPRGIAIDKESNLFVTCGQESTGTYFISIINDKQIVSTYTTHNLLSPRGLAVDVNDDQSLYICNMASTLGKIIRNKYIFDVEDNILQPENNKLLIVDTTDDKIIDAVEVDVNCSVTS